MLRRGEPPRANAELYSVSAIPHESKASTASQRGVLPHRATNAARNGLSGTHTWPCAGKRTTYRPARGGGRRVDHRRLEVVAHLPEDELRAGLRAAVEGEALVPDADGYGYRFRHALLQEAAHEQLLPGEHTRLHRAFAEALKQDPSLAAGGSASVHAELAHHALAAHDVDLAFTSLVLAGQRARDLFAYAEA